MEAPLTPMLLTPMGRTPRHHYPGATFHLTARTQDHVDSFAGKLYGPAEEIILDVVAASDAMLLAQIIIRGALTAGTAASAARMRVLRTLRLGCNYSSTNRATIRAQRT